MPEKVSEKNGKTPKNQVRETSKEQVKETQEINELRQELVHILSDLESESRERPGQWVSRIWLTGVSNGEPLFHVVVSMRNGEPVLWVKPPTLKNGFPLIVDSNITTKIDKLIQILTIVKENVDILSGKVTNRPKRMPRGGIAI